MSGNMLELYSVSTKCRFCGGRCFVPGNPKETQERAHKLFFENKHLFNDDASIPNGCVPNSDGEVRCSKEMGLI